MRNRILILLLVITASLMSCKDDDDASDSDNLLGEWNLMNVSGGIGGSDLDYLRGTVVWNFSPEILVVTKPGPTDTGLEVISEGTYSYSLISANSRKYLVMNGQEVGEIIVSEASFTIDQNEYSTGSGNDGFELYLER